MTHVLRSSRYVVRYAAMVTGVKGGGFGVHTAVSSSGFKTYLRGVGIDLDTQKVWSVGN
ncbi:hypothetical protein [Anaplasma phagocytophilum]|uniref:hypothetical protein n=1 Tax=Anaplasma phagocytophilum TaxID=948 RepID=UPI0020101251|nr:hypothetical protein [Anaplasma phagocytophilum]